MDEKQPQLRFEIGKYYKGRYMDCMLHVFGEAETMRWGKTLLAETTPCPNVAEIIALKNWESSRDGFYETTEDEWRGLLRTKTSSSS